MSRKTRKLIWSVPLVATLAIVGVLAVFVALAPNEVSAQNVEIPPGRPLNLTAVAYEEGIPQEEIQLNWDVPTDGGSPRHYRIDISENGGYTWVALESDVRNNRYTHQGLLAGETFHYRVFAENQHGTSRVSDTEAGSTDEAAVPDRPTDLTAVVGVQEDNTDFTADTVAELMIMLNWVEPTDPPGAPVTGYKVEYSVDGTVWDPVDDVSEPGDSDAGLEAGYAYLYRVAAVNSVGQSGWSSTATDSTLRGAVPTPPMDLRSAVTPTELNVWLFWAPPDSEPMGDAITGYEVQGRPKAVANAMLSGGIPSPLAELQAVTDGTQGVDANDVDPDDNRGTLTFGTGTAAVTVEDINLGDVTDFAGVATAIALAINDATGSQTMFGSNPTVTYTGLRFVLTTNGVTTKLPIPSSSGSPDLAALLGWTTAEGAVSRPAYACCPETEPEPDIEGWKIVKTDISKPSGEEINQFLVTVQDIDRTGYGDRFYANADWEFRVRPLNRRAPARAENAGLTDPLVATSASVELVWSDADPSTPVVADPIEATPGSDTALKRPEALRVTRSNEDNQGRTGLILSWNKATTVRDADGNTVNAQGYRIEYSDSGLLEEGYDWKVLQAVFVPLDGTDDGIERTEELAESRQEFIDNHEVLGGSADALAAGHRRHYRVFALNAVTPAGAANTGTLGADNEMSWPSPQNSGHTADPLQPNPPQSLRAIPGGHTSIKLEWTAPDASNDDHDGSEEGPSVITHYVIQSSDDEGVTWQALATTKTTAYEDKDLLPGQTRDYQVAAVNSSQQSIWSNTVDETTIPAVLPNEPGGLVAESAGSGTIKLCWNTQAEQPEDAPVFEYLIQQSPDGETDWTDLATVTEMTDDDVHTIYTDTSDLSPEEARYYRVFAINLRGQSDQSDVASATTDGAGVPGAPTVTLGTVTDTEINLSWTEPADNGGADIIGWIVEKAYGGSFLNAERTNDDAFTDAETWWDGLDCSARVMAVMDDGTADMDNPFCAMYADLGDTEEAEVERVFDVRYFIIDDAAANSYRHYNLPQESERMYRLAAVNGAGIGMWSNAITATTLATDTTLGEPSRVAATSSGGTITVNWMPGANAASQVIVAVNASDDTDYCLHVDTSGMLAEHECPNLTAGQTYVVLIIALDGQGGYELGNVVSHTAN